MKLIPTSLLLGVPLIVALICLSSQAHTQLGSARGGEDPGYGPTAPEFVASSGLPLVVAPDAALYYPESTRDGHVRIMRIAPSGALSVFASLPAAMEIGSDGRSERARWIHGLAASRDGSLYYSEQRAVRKISPDGYVSPVADPVEVPECAALHGAGETVPALRGLDVADDGSVYVAAAACKALVKISPSGASSVVIRTSDSWSPTGVAVVGDEIYMLEHYDVENQTRENWLPRIRKISPDGATTVVAAVTGRPFAASRSRLARAAARR